MLHEPVNRFDDEGLPVSTSKTFPPLVRRSSRSTARNTRFREETRNYVVVAVAPGTR